jgi:hypothetical protein
MPEEIKPTPAPANPTPTPLVDDDAVRREQARRALEGADWTTKRETEERAKTIQEQITSAENKLAEIRGQKEKLELAWVDLDDRKKSIRLILNPLLDEEKKLEAEETALETEEASIGIPESKHAIEIKRWPLQEKRKEIEQKKWQEEEKIIAIDQSVESNTKAYRSLLEEEDKLMAELDKLRLDPTLILNNNQTDGEQ